MTSLETTALVWLAARKRWFDLGIGDRSYTPAERDDIVLEYGRAELALEAEATKLGERMVTS